MKTRQAAVAARTVRFGDALATALPVPPGITPSPDPIPLGETAADRDERIAVQMRNRLARYMRQRPAEFAAASLSDADEHFRAMMLGWYAGRSRTLVITGPVGVGKSHLAYAMTNHAATDGVIVAAWTLQDLLDGLAGHDQETARLAHLVPLLLLDDLGAEDLPPWHGPKVTALLDARYRAGLRQVVTTNETYNALRERYGDRTMSRLTGGCTRIVMAGPDRRRVTW